MQVWPSEKPCCGCAAWYNQGLLVCRWMAALVESKQPNAACLAILRKGADLGAKDKGLEIRDASAKLAALCAGTPEVCIGLHEPRAPCQPCRQQCMRLLSS